MTTNVVTVKPKTLISEVFRIMLDKQVNCLPVVNEFGKVVGTIGHNEFFSNDFKVHFPTYINLFKDIGFVSGDKKEMTYEIKRIANLKAEDIMTQNGFFALPDMTLDQLTNKYISKKTDTFPVADSNNKLLGIVSRSDALKALGAKNVANEPRSENRHADNILVRAERDFNSRYIFIAKSRVNMWRATAISLFVVGFIVGILYVANPDFF